ncbi:MAG: NAD(+) diphosphatase [Oscillospiraceae bacterium]|nr:NAD(+) diphosphatase [Oscillospiraceae bacterium]
MIQDISPSRLDNSYRPYKAGASDYVLCFDTEGRILCDTSDGLVFTTGADAKGSIYLFSVDDRRFFLSDRNDVIKPGYEYRSVRDLRAVCTGSMLFAAFTAYHLWRWYSDNIYCGRCGQKLSPHDTERALVCACGNTVYPRINPAVIVGVSKGESILITRYQRGYAHNALVAGFTEIGETLEQTVAREVMEETGIRVKNIRYYKSQPWAPAQDLLAGFFCEADGDDPIRRDDSELRYAEWVDRKDIVLQPDDVSLTNEMMRMFKDGRIQIL